MTHVQPTSTAPLTRLPKDLKVGFIGCGNMGRAIAEAWLAREVIEPSQLLISARTSAEATAEALGARAIESNKDLIDESDIVVLGFKPQQLHQVSGLSDLCDDRPLYISLLAGKSVGELKSICNPDNRGAQIIRLMPNLPARLSQGATLAYTKAQLSEKRGAWLTTLLDAIGHTEWLSSEEQFDAATAISGCGPAYMFMIIEALADAGVSLGLPRLTAQRLAAQTMLGSGMMALDEHPGVLKDRVTSPGGVTIQGVRSLERSGLRSAMIEAVVRAAKRSQELGS